jgi:hypothetical protein
MGQITDTLRKHLREIAHSDARSLRAIGGTIQTGATKELRTEAAQDLEDLPSREHLRHLPKAQLYSMCKEKGLKRLSKARKDELIEALLRDGGSPPMPPLSVTARLDRLEKVLRLIAREVGIPQEQLEEILNS